MGTTQHNFKSIITDLARPKSACVKTSKPFTSVLKKLMLLLGPIRILISPPLPCLAQIAKHLVFLCCGTYQIAKHLVFLGCGTYENI